MGVWVGGSGYLGDLGVWYWNGVEFCLVVFWIDDG